ncbi:hypothetical protein KA078_00410 [Candidatus Woesebacteria bacterium]|nr:hypothetical protein [Candidatus Woesebacteria bacterium]
MKIVLGMIFTMIFVWIFSAVGWIQYGVSGGDLVIATVFFSITVAVVLQVVSFILIGFLWASTELAYIMFIPLPLVGLWASAWFFETLFGPSITIESWSSGLIMGVVMIFMTVIKK